MRDMPGQNSAGAQVLQAHLVEGLRVQRLRLHEVWLDQQRRDVLQRLQSKWLPASTVVFSGWPALAQGLHVQSCLTT